MDPQDAATKAYVDASSGSGSQNLSQVLTIGSERREPANKQFIGPTLPQDAATKAYVDANGGGGSQDLTQVLLQGNDAGGVQIENLVDQNDPQGAATQNYVETRIATILGAVAPTAWFPNVALFFWNVNRIYRYEWWIQWKRRSDPVFATDAQVCVSYFEYNTRLDNVYKHTSRIRG